MARGLWWTLAAVVMLFAVLSREPRNAQLEPRDHGQLHSGRRRRWRWRWLIPFVGSALIVLASFVGGVFGYQVEQDIAQDERRLGQLALALQDSEMQMGRADTGERLAILLWHVRMQQIPRDETGIEQALGAMRELGAQDYVALVEAHDAANLGFSNETQQYYAYLRDQIGAGDTEALK